MFSSRTSSGSMPNDIAWPTLHRVSRTQKSLRDVEQQSAVVRTLPDSENLEVDAVFLSLASLWNGWPSESIGQDS